MKKVIELIEKSNALANKSGKYGRIVSTDDWKDVVENNLVAEVFDLEETKRYLNLCKVCFLGNETQIAEFEKACKEAIAELFGEAEKPKRKKRVNPNDNDNE